MRMLHSGSVQSALLDPPLRCGPHISSAWLFTCLQILWRQSQFRAGEGLVSVSTFVCACVRVCVHAFCLAYCVTAHLRSVCSEAMWLANQLPLQLL